MTMNTGIARALRRFAGGAAIMVTALTGMHHRLFADVEFVPAGVDRIVVTSPRGYVHEITDPARVAQVVRFIRSRQHSARLPDPRHHASFPPPNTRVDLYRATEAQRSIWFRAPVIAVMDQTMVEAAFGISAGDAAEFRRLLSAPDAPASRPVQR